ncbi:MAG TPA: hypothetical protein VLX92_32790 [Kofleriaceae bacterium]|nr:hypothetical protein [Kofleriaceae bacterium]
MSARARKPTTRPPRNVEVHDSIEDARTHIFDSGNFTREAATPIRAVSMKTPGEVDAPRETSRPVPRVQLRAISEVSELARAQCRNLGHIAPPRERPSARPRAWRDYVMIGSLSLIVASVIAIIIWFAGR